jgi:hypothetical protein
VRREEAEYGRSRSVLAFGICSMERSFSSRRETGPPQERGLPAGKRGPSDQGKMPAAGCAPGSGGVRRVWLPHLLGDEGGATGVGRLNGQAHLPPGEARLDNDGSRQVGKVRVHTRAGGGQVQPVLDGLHYTAVSISFTGSPTL